MCVGMPLTGMRGKGGGGAPDGRAPRRCQRERGPAVAVAVAGPPLELSKPSDYTKRVVCREATWRRVGMLPLSQWWWRCCDVL